MSNQSERFICDESCSNCQERNLSLMAGLSQMELVHLDQNRHILKYNSGEVIYKEGTKPTGLLCLRKGKIKLTKRGIDGRDQIISLKRPVDFVGFGALFTGRNHENSAIALEESVLCHIDKEDFLHAARKNSDLSFKIMKALSDELALADLRLINLTQKHMRGRMAEALLMIKETYGPSTHGLTLNARLKRSEWAALANMTTSNAIRMLSSFAKENLIEVNHREIKLMNLKELESISTNPWHRNN